MGFEKNELFNKRQISDLLGLGWVSGFFYCLAHAVWYLSEFGGLQNAFFVAFQLKALTIFIVYVVFVSTAYTVLWCPFVLAIYYYKGLDNRILVPGIAIYGFLAPFLLLKNLNICSLPNTVFLLVSCSAVCIWFSIFALKRR